MPFSSTDYGADAESKGIIFINGMGMNILLESQNDIKEEIYDERFFGNGAYMD